MYVMELNILDIYTVHTVISSNTLAAMKENRAYVEYNQQVRSKWEI